MKTMNRIAIVVIACLGVTTALLLYLRVAEATATATASHPGAAEIVERLDRLERSIAQLAATRLGAAPATDSAALVTTAASGRPEPERERERVATAHAVTIRAGNEVVDRALSVGQWTAEDVRALAESTEALDGEAAAAIRARVAAAINSDRLKVDPAALRP
jgi:hypothetical protein